jgi:hypothetical protein
LTRNVPQLKDELTFRADPMPMLLPAADTIVAIPLSE